MAKKTITLFILGLMLSFSGMAQITYNWGFGLGNTSSSGNNATATQYDASGNLYVAGRFYDTLDFDPGSGTSNLSAGGHVNSYIAKYSPSGNLVWAKHFTNANNQAYDFALDPRDGNLYITGVFTSSVDFDPDTGTANLSAGHPTTYAGYICKLDSNGNYQWATRMRDAQQVSVTGHVYPYKIALDTTNDRLVVVGEFNTDVDFYDSNGLQTTSMKSVGGLDDFVAKYTLDGFLDNAVRFGGSGNEVPFGTVMDNTGKIYVCGYFEGTCDFGTSGPSVPVSSQGARDFFILKLSSNGAFENVVATGSAQHDIIYDLAVDANNNIYAAGVFKDSIQLIQNSTSAIKLVANGTGYDAFIAKFNSDLKTIWAKSYGSPDNEYAQDLFVNGNILYVSGIFDGTNGDFDPGTGITLGSSLGGNDGYMSKFDTSGNFDLFTQIGAGGEDRILDIAVFDNKISTVGYLQNTVDLDPTSGTDNYTAAGSTDIFVQSLTSTPSSGKLDDILNSQITIYPNPTTNSLNILANELQITEVSVLDMSGKMLINSKNAVKTLELNNLSNGMYILRIVTNKGIARKRFIKQ